LEQVINPNNNPLEQIEHQTTNWIESFIQALSTARDASFELTFHQLYGGMAALLPEEHHKSTKLSRNKNKFLNIYFTMAKTALDKHLFGWFYC